MSHRSQELARRRQQLQVTCAHQRAQIEQLMQDIEAPTQKIDHFIGNVQRVLSKPWILVAGLAVLAFVGPRRVIRLAGRAWLLGSTARRMLNR